MEINEDDKVELKMATSLARVIKGNDKPFCIASTVFVNGMCMGTCEQLLSHEQIVQLVMNGSSSAELEGMCHEFSREEKRRRRDESVSANANNIGTAQGSRAN